MSLKKITNSLSKLNHQELEELKKVVSLLLESEEEEITEDQREETNENLMRISLSQAKAGGKRRRGHVEEKMIRGYGPYLYLRYWEGGSLKSLYIGKKEE